MRIGILTISDRSSKGEREDLSGPAIIDLVSSQGWQVSKSGIVSDDQSEIEAILREWSDSGDLNVILTSGGTGFAGRDRAPEATMNVIERSAPGIAEAMRAESLKVTPHAMLSRGTAGIRGSVLIINLPGSPKAAVENLEVIIPALPHAVQLLKEDPRAEEGHDAITAKGVEV
ncbi:MAG: molybdenum cofactor biosynthesis protein [Anaerolineales bacterium]|nr:molybdenum cofactor biosynthesis protein [Anaerolineales bacterium]